MAREDISGDIRDKNACSLVALVISFSALMTIQKLRAQSFTEETTTSNEIKKPLKSQTVKTSHPNKHEEEQRAGKGGKTEAPQLVLALAYLHCA